MLWSNVRKLLLHIITYTKVKYIKLWSKSSITKEDHDKILSGVLKQPILFLKVPHGPLVHDIKVILQKLLTVDIKEAHQIATPRLIQHSHWGIFLNAWKHQLWSLWHFLWKFGNNFDESCFNNIWVLGKSNQALFLSMFLT